MTAPFSPIFIVGVPRSGTTLLRVLLDSHSQILALPETPWISAAYGGCVSLRHLLLDLMEGPYGAVRNIAGIEREHVLEAGSGFLEQLFQPALEARGKSVLAFKTPSDIPYLEFMAALLPEARYIHITRDGRDVALSQLKKKGTFFQDLPGYRSFDYANVFRRWMEWEQTARSILSGGKLHVLRLRYEDLIADPAAEMRRVTDFLGLPFEPAMLDYAAQSHDYPKWEAGSTDVAQRDTVNGRSVGKWQKQSMSIEAIHTLKRHDNFLVSLGYPPTRFDPNWRQEALVWSYGVVRPLLEAVTAVMDRLRPLARSRDRMLACALLLMMTGQMLAPWQNALSVGFLLGPALCFAATVSFIFAFGPVLQRQAGIGPWAATMRGGFLMLGYLVLLQAAHLLLHGPSSSLTPLLLSLAAILAALPMVSWIPRAQARTA